MGAWDAVITGIIGAGTAYYSSKQAKKQSEGVHDEWERRMAYEEEKLNRKRNSMGAKVAPHILEQMLRVYGEQSKGRGGFTLPIDEILSSMNISGRKDGSYSYGGDSQLSPGINIKQKSDMNQARIAGDRSYAVGKVDPEIGGYNGKVWSDRQVSAGLEGAPSSSAWGVSASEVGGPRETTRGMGNTKTQTERGYTTVTKPLGPGSVMSSTEQIPNIEGDLATGGVGLFESKDIEIPPDLGKRLIAGGLKAGMSMFLPGIGTVMNIGGKVVQKMGKSDGKQSNWETVLGVKDSDYGRFTSKNGMLSKIFGGFGNQSVANEPTIGRGI